MAGWLPDNFQVPEQTVEKAVGSVQHKIRVRRSTQRALKASGGFMAVALVAVLFGGKFFMDDAVIAPPSTETLAAVTRPEVPQEALQAPETSARASTETVSAPEPVAPKAKAPYRSSRRAKVEKALPVSLVKLDHSVAVQWKGDQAEEYEVYRCSTPQFETCSLVDEVRGTTWVDRGLDSLSNASTIVYYQVVPRTGA